MWRSDSKPACPDLCPDSQIRSPHCLDLCPNPPTSRHLCSTAAGCNITISGASNSNRALPKGANLNGFYMKTNHSCSGKPTWQQEGNHGLVLCWWTVGSGWEISTSDAVTKCWA